MVKSEYADDEMIMSGKTSCNEEEDEDMAVEWSQEPNSVSTEERSPLRAQSDNSSTGSIGNDGEMNGGSGALSSNILDGPPTRNGSVTPLDDRRLRRQIANCNERRRMQSINAGFQALRSLLPRKDGEKMSKAAILQQTADYIQALQDEKSRLVDENNSLAQSKKRRIGSDFPEKMDVSDSSIPVIKSQPLPTVNPTEVIEYLRTIDDLKLALSKEHRLRVIYEREVYEMRAKSMQDTNASLGVLRAAAGVQSLLSSQPLAFDPSLRPDSTILMPTATPLQSAGTPHDSLLLAASQQVYNNVLLNAAAAAATTPPALATVAPTQLSPHRQGVPTNSSSPFHQPQIRSTIADLVVSSSSGLSSPACMIDAATPVTLHNMAASAAAHAVANSVPSSFAVMPQKTAGLSPLSATAPTANGVDSRGASTQMTQRNLQAIIDAIRHIEGNNIAARIAVTSSPSPHSTDLLVR